MCFTKLPEFRKTSPISSIFIKTFWIFFLVKDLTNRVPFLWDHSFWEHTFLARMRRLKNGWPLSAPTMAYFQYPQQIGNSFRKWRMMSAFTAGFLGLNKSIASLQRLFNLIRNTYATYFQVCTKQTCRWNNRASK